eukprot:TRINITY_DN6660_c0_g1_i1.p1 TRINITY_DN6660_c0_g1~~TRINITY_DN6660_c0_g1_i1.p1  ORF type:complete len:413 (+),score=84.63 TRINITY_DN6660_c0_g1_i1:524-1762(+)
MYHILVGTYDRALYGWNVQIGEKGPELTKFFNHIAHLGCLKSLHSNGHLALSGGTDEAIKVYDLTKMKEIGSLVEHQDAISCVRFYGQSHAFSGSVDGVVCIWRTKDWECIRTLHAHKGSVNCISVHPSGKLALTVGKDKKLQLWNLVNGRSAHNTLLAEEAQLVSWSPNGSTYAMCLKHTIRVFKTEGGKVSEYSPSKKRPILSFVYLTENLIASGGEDRKIRIWDINTGKTLITLRGFENRVKSIATIPKLNTESKHPYYIISISSDQYLRVWDLDYSTEDPSVQEYIEGRPTCLAASVVEQSKTDGEESAEASATPVSNNNNTQKQSPKATKTNKQTSESKESQQQNQSQNTKKRKRSNSNGTTDGNKEQDQSEGSSSNKEKEEETRPPPKKKTKSQKKAERKQKMNQQ